ncbi:MAG: DNA polymerase III subunit beta [Candidatus Omnitrophica bacterium CG_4_9_14_0_2_um_filter_42_8]|nr:MAG: DNA polymerase III subunit beta [Candidatus Omnitrophica bacterium CG22_combo_CG10-13_8_21_14_all_43_16]PJC48636.1 MAG: DNA polymerase III subunit beta [Candidatus Omnitrophica bacterium CG_4_9_14_0_2_um_filter_42_8]
MKIKILKQVFLRNIQHVQNIISSKSSLPILSNILIEAEKNKVVLTTTDLDIGISSALETEVEEEGAITIPAKRFNDIIKELPDEDISISTMKNNSMVIKCSKCFFKIIGLPKEEFPKLPEFKDEPSVVIKQSVLKNMIAMTHFSMSRDETRYVLNGALFLFKGKKLAIVTTDGKRLSFVKKDLEKDGLNKAIVIPSKTIYELNRILNDEGDVKIVFSENQVKFDLKNITVISRLIEGDFPNYEQVVPKEPQEKIIINRGLFLDGIKRAALLTTQDSQSVRFEILKNKIVVSKSSPNIGEVREELDTVYKGHEITVGFNPGYVMDALKVIPQDEIALEVFGPDKPAVIRIEDWFLYLVLPMQLV